MRNNINFGYTYRQNPGTDDSIRTRIIFICDAMDRLHERIEGLDLETKNLLQQGISQAVPYWMRKDDPSGKPDQLELTHPADSDYYRANGTRREYIGVKPDKIAAALAAIERGRRVSILDEQIRRKKTRLRNIERQIGLLETMARAEQQVMDI